MFVNLLFSILLFFVPLSFAATEPWAFFIFQITVSFIFLYLLFTKYKFVFTIPATLINIIFLLLIFVAIVQLLNHHTIIQPKSILPFTVSPFHTLKELNSIFTYMMLFILVTQMVDRLEKIKKLLYLLLFVSAIVMFIGLCFPNGEYIKFFLGTESIGNFGPFTNRNNAGIFLSQAFFISLSFIIYNFLRYEKYLIQNQKRKYIVIQIINITISLMLLLSVIVTRSRGAMLATFISIFIFLFLYIYHFSALLKQKIFKTLCLLVLFCISSFIIYKNMDIINLYSNRITGISEQTRLDLYNMSFDVLKDYPITGIGFASFPIVIDKYLYKDLGSYPEYLHSDWLELLLDIGYPLYIIFLFLVFIILILYLKRIKFLSNKKKILFIGLFSSVCSICIGSLVDFHFHIPANAMFFVVCLSILSSISFHKDKKNITFNNNWLYKIIFCILIMGLLYFSFKNVVAWKYYTFSKNLSKQQKIEYLKKATCCLANPKYLESYIITAYNNSPLDEVNFVNNKPDLCSISYEYLKKYPYNNKISKIYAKFKE